MSKHKQNRNHQNRGTQGGQRGSQRGQKQTSSSKLQAGDAQGSELQKVLAEKGEQIGMKVREEMKGRLSSMKDSLGGEYSLDFDAARRALTKAGETALESIKRNPMPIALTGLGIACTGAGIAWLMMGQSNGKAEPRASQMTMGGFDKPSSNGNGNSNGITRQIGTSVKQAAKSIKHATEAATTKGSRLAHDAAASGKRLEKSIEEIVKEHPVAVGAALLAIGAGIALAIPSTAIENTWIGRERDQVVRGAQKMAKGAMEKVETLAKQVTGNSNAQA